MRHNIKQVTSKELEALLSETYKMKQENTQENFINAVRNHSFIVGSVDTNGFVSFSTTPVIHTSRTSVRDEAKRLAKMSPGKLFTFVELSGAEMVQLQPSISI